MYASACVLRNKMKCGMKSDYSEEEVRSVNLTRSSSLNCAQRQGTGQDVWSWVRMQWMTVTSLVLCHALHALHVPQHVAVSLSKSLNLMISSAPSTETVFAYLNYCLNTIFQKRHFSKSYFSETSQEKYDLACHLFATQKS